MKSANYRLLRFCLLWGLMLPPMTIAANGSRAQSSGTSHARTDYEASATDETPAANLTVELDDDGSAEITFDFESNLEQKYNFPALLSRTLDCPLEDLSFSRDKQSETTSLSARCELPLSRRSFRHIGRIDLQPLRKIQNAEPDVAFFLLVSVPKGNSPALADCAYFLVPQSVFNCVGRGQSRCMVCVSPFSLVDSAFGHACLVGCPGSCSRGRIGQVSAPSPGVA